MIYRIQDLIFELDKKRKNLNLSNSLLINLKDQQIRALEDDLEKYSNLGIQRDLEGQYIGDINNTNKKYHFRRDSPDWNCPDWHSLVGKYILQPDLSESIFSKKNSDFFIDQGFTLCKNCEGRKSSQRSSTG